MSATAAAILCRSQPIYICGCDPRRSLETPTRRFLQMTTPTTTYLYGGESESRAYLHDIHDSRMDFARPYYFQLRPRTGKASHSSSRSLSSCSISFVLLCLPAMYASASACYLHCASVRRTKQCVAWLRLEHFATTLGAQQEVRDISIHFISGPRVCRRSHVSCLVSFN